MNATLRVIVVLALLALIILGFEKFSIELLPPPEDSAAAGGVEQQLMEVRIFQCENLDKQSATLNYVENALVPALNRQGVETVGTFLPSDKKNTSVVVMIPYTSAKQWVEQNDKLEIDTAYQAAATAYFALPEKDPAFLRIDSRIMRAFAGMPKIELPSIESGDRILELRIYESYNEKQAKLKVDMFNQGEIDLMKKVGLSPVFFGETLAAGDVPNLTYILSATNQEIHKKHWQDFMAHPEWDRMKNLPLYRGTVSKITSVMLFPTQASQI